MGVEGADEVGGGKLDGETAATAGDVDQRQVGHRGVDDARVRSSLAKRRDAADDVPSHPLCGCRVEHAGLLGAERAGERFQAELAGNRDHRGHGDPVDFGHQRLAHRRRVQTELADRFVSEGLRPWVVLVFQHSVRNACRLQRLKGRSGGAAVSWQIGDLNSGWSVAAVDAEAVESLSSRVTGGASLRLTCGAERQFEHVSEG